MNRKHLEYRIGQENITYIQ